MDLGETEKTLRSYFETRICDFAGETTDGSSYEYKLLKMNNYLAERGGFEPPIEFPLYTISNRAPSTTRPSLLGWFTLSNLTHAGGCFRGWTGRENELRVFCKSRHKLARLLDRQPRKLCSPAPAGAGGSDLPQAAFAFLHLRPVGFVTVPQIRVNLKDTRPNSRA